MRHRLVVVCVVAQRDGPARPSRRATTQPCMTVLLKAIEWSASVMHFIECSASSFNTSLVFPDKQYGDSLVQAVTL